MNMRPGVYTEYNISKVEGVYKGRSIGIIAAGAELAISKKISTIEEAESAFLPGSNALLMAQTILNSCFCDIYAVGAEAGDIATYKAACELLFSLPQPYCIVTDFEGATLTEYVANQLKSSKLFFASGAGIADCIAHAKMINYERVCITSPKITNVTHNFDLSPLFLAILVQLGTNININLAGEVVYGKYLIPEMTEESKNHYLEAGISVFEKSGDSISLIRAVTSKTLNHDGNLDLTYRNICVIAAVDRVKTVLHDALTRRLANPASSIGSIQSLVVNELVSLYDIRAISSYDKPVVTLDDNDKSICKISVNVTINQGLNQIYLNLNMSV